MTHCKAEISAISDEEKHMLNEYSNHIVRFKQMTHFKENIGVLPFDE